MSSPRSKTTVQTEHALQGATTRDGAWYSRSPADVEQAVGVDPSVGLSAARAADRLRANGPNTLPEEQPRPGWLRFLEQYRSYMRIILVITIPIPRGRV
jgi:P-type Ca2+ transporter type 2C